MKQIDTLSIVGAGLIGASIGLAAKRVGVARRIVGVGRRAASLAEAQRRGAIDAAELDLGAGVKDSELVIVCTPVDAIVDTVRSVIAAAPGTLVTDAGSTKAEIVAQLARDLPAQARFIGSHPMAGDSKTGPQFARAELFDGRTVVVTPTAASSVADRQFLGEFWESLGARVLEMPPEEHDRAVAATSHLPHLLASAIAGSTPEHYFPLIATGWRDTTRVAEADAALWRQILLANRENVLAALQTFDATLAALRRSLEAADADALEHLLAEAKRNRDAVGS